MQYHPPPGSEHPYIKRATFDQCSPADKIRAYLLLRRRAVSAAILKRLALPGYRGSLRAYLHADLRDGLVIQTPYGYYKLTTQGQQYYQARLQHVVINMP
jgi:hypothetical protein